MPDAPFRPFGSSDAEYEQLLVLQDGVPQALLEPALAWIVSRTITGRGSTRYLHQEMANQIRALTEVDLGARTGAYIWEEDYLKVLRRLEPLSILRVIDALLSVGPSNREVIDRALKQARSMWTVGSRDERLGLVSRIAEGELASVERLVTRGTAGALLHKSFSAAFGLQPNAGEAYKMAVKAVETAAHQTIELKNTGASLGTMLSVMRNAMKSDSKAAAWTLPLAERADHIDGNREMIVAMMQSLWDGQEDRHRDGEVDIREARAAFHAAVAIVGWFTDELVQPGPQ